MKDSFSLVLLLQRLLLALLTVGTVESFVILPTTPRLSSSLSPVCQQQQLSNNIPKNYPPRTNLFFANDINDETTITKKLIQPRVWRKALGLLILLSLCRLLFLFNPLLDALFVAFLVIKGLNLDNEILKLALDDDIFNEKHVLGLNRGEEQQPPQKD